MARDVQYKVVPYTEIQDHVDKVARAYAKEVGAPKPKNPQHDLMRHLDSSGALVCIKAESPNQVFGFACFGLQASVLDRKHNVATESLFYVYQEGRHSGIASGMLEFAEKEIAARGCHTVVMCSMPDNDISKMLEGRGYNLTEQWFSKEVK